MIRRQSIFIVGVLLIILGLSMFFSVAWSLVYREGDLVPLLQSIAVTISFGFLLVLIFRTKEKKELTIQKYVNVINYEYGVADLASDLKKKNLSVKHAQLNGKEHNYAN